ncbi:MAG: GGDEF domain-containing protein [Halomonas sp.]|uniref:diguanylate cyclase n=1 Tax=Billgrantia tianxiuensis TaxID=2497861 RepID=A0A6I6SNI4_9GAMM|nr:MULTISPECIES: GGDEF domain-containing protein [Halomonas]MCE8031936.1 diguanylate cyclase [Halomonas sp. MCCC 1A11057]MDX5435076.1 GGDEF domain-containing protein [Halomonas sp.]QHC49994.1 GGDEF domain-containing protein [Halomonas tianxiuensis]
MSIDRISTAEISVAPGPAELGLPPLPDTLRSRLAECRTLPSLPAAAARVIAIARSPEPRLADYARTFEQDPALALRLLSMANSAFYSRNGNPVSSSLDAVSRIGLDATLAIALSFGLPRPRAGGNLDHEYLCQRAIIAASATQELAQHLCPDHAPQLFTTALLQDIGILALEALDGEAYVASLPDLHQHQKLAEAERQRYGCDHALIGAWLAASWGVPGPIAAGIIDSHGPLADGDPRQLCLRLSCRIADCWLAADSATAFSALLRQLASLASLDIVMLMTVMQELQHRLPSLARLFEITCPPAIDSAHLLAEAKELLFEQNLRMTIRLAEQQRELEALHASHVVLDEQHRTDHLTQLANRPWLEKRLTQHFDCARQTRQPLTVMFIDLDHFKRINDRFGHRFGDEVLIHFAAALNNMVRESDIAGRYGGEEFLVIMPNTRRQQAGILADRIREYLASQPLAQADGEPLHVTASIGIADLEDGEFEDATALVDAADQAMYGVKHGGRDGVGHYEEPDSST